MVLAHICLPSMIRTHISMPATMSKAVVTELLRREIGYEDAVFSDDLEMKAISDRHAIEDAGLLAIEAGCDLLLVCSDVEAAARLRERLALEAKRSGGFRSRLQEAAARADRLRRRVDSLPPAIPLENALDNPELRAIQARLQGLE